MSMTPDSSNFEGRYQHALSTYLDDVDAQRPVEGPLVDALDLGRTALAGGPSLLDLLSMHHAIIFAPESSGVSAGEIKGRLAHGAEFLAQILAPFEMTRRGWNDVVTRLRRMNETLEQQVAERTAALREAEQRLAQVQKLDAIGSLTGGMAHDFNNLLSVILGNLELARPLITAMEDVDELVGDAFDAARKGAELTRRLLAFARRQPLQPAIVELNDVVGGIVSLLGRTLGEHIEISLDLATDIWPVLVDAAQLEASITNLATNARDAMPKGGRLTISTTNRRLDADYAASHPDVVPGDYATIEVSDTGTGMDAAVMAQIFEPFYTTKQRGEGTGLGLSMVFGFMKQSGGHINVYSEPGIGTTFRLYLPRVTKNAGATQQRSAAEEVPRGNGEVVLAVEDNAALRRLVVRQLEELGYRVIEAESAPVALAVLHSKNVNVVFTDIVMPGGMDGFELARIVVDRWPAVMVVLTSGFPDSLVDGTLGSRPPSVHVLNKPYARKDLARILRDTLRTPRS